jgi:hypothetical protein
VPSGDVVLTFTAWESRQQRNVYMKRSSDNCQTWGGITQISEPGWYCTNNDHVLGTSTGRVILPSHGGPGFEFKPGNSLHSFVFYSDDDCATWQTRESRHSEHPSAVPDHAPPAVHTPGPRRRTGTRQWLRRPGGVSADNPPDG